MTVMHTQPQRPQQLGKDFVERVKDYPYTIRQGLLKLQPSKDIELLHRRLHAVPWVQAEVEKLGLRSIEPTSLCLRNELKFLRNYQKAKNLFHSISLE